MAGWTVPPALAAQFAASGSHLERYASRLGSVEINSSFYRPHRRSTYERWAASVPAGFRFAVKLPKAITHERKLIGGHDLLRRFGEEVRGLGETRGPVLVQLPPGLRFDAAVADSFFREARATLGGQLVCEPRHPSWFCEEADRLMVAVHVARAAADPAVVPYAGEPGGWRELGYFRLHGSPRTYWSDYPSGAIEAHAVRVRNLRAEGRPVWTIFDNTAAGNAPSNALALNSLTADASTEAA